MRDDELRGMLAGLAPGPAGPRPTASELRGRATRRRSLRLGVGATVAAAVLVIAAIVLPPLVAPPQVGVPAANPSPSPTATPTLTASDPAVCREFAQQWDAALTSTPALPTGVGTKPTVRANYLGVVVTGNSGGRTVSSLFADGLDGPLTASYRPEAGWEAGPAARAGDTVIFSARKTMSTPDSDGPWRLVAVDGPDATPRVLLSQTQGSQTNLMVLGVFNRIVLWMEVAGTDGRPVSPGEPATLRVRGVTLDGKPYRTGIDIVMDRFQHPYLFIGDTSVYLRPGDGTAWAAWDLRTLTPTPLPDWFPPPSDVRSIAPGFRSHLIVTGTGPSGLAVIDPTSGTTRPITAEFTPGFTMYGDTLLADLHDGTIVTDLRTGATIRVRERAVREAGTLIQLIAGYYVRPGQTSPTYDPGTAVPLNSLPLTVPPGC